MKKFAAMFLVCALLPAVGCRKAAGPEAGSTGPELKKMLSRTDVLLVKHFYTEKSVAEDARGTGALHAIPGGVSLQPIWVYEPNKKSSGQKGASILVVSWSYYDPDVGALRGQKHETAYLDLDELRDLANALDYFASNDSAWRAGNGVDHVEVEFESKDQFQLSIFHGGEGDALYAEIGAATASLNTQKVSELHNIVQSAIDKLSRL